ncbi:MAG: bifunctional metallophosphatase/5'-nucleotidase [Clostridia bacterium]|nr:bifunctional metallophosphatase/5'-nucleotidase [Clostridia bacterium]
MKKRFLSLLLAALLLLSACNRSTDAANTTTDTSSSTVTTAPPLGEDCIGHADGNDDGRCDSCLGSVLATVDFYAINDLHGKFADTDAQPGVDELTTYLKTSAAADDHAIFLSSGDMWQGSSESNLTEGLIVTEWMNSLDFVSMTLGNHEFDWGEAPIEKNVEAAEFPFLAINIYDRETNARVDYADASVIVERGDAQIGIIGAIGDCYSSIAADKVEGVYFKVGPDLTALVKAEAERLRSEGADFIVYSLHDGYGSSSSGESLATDAKLSSYYGPVLSDGSVDLVFEAHTHQRYTMVDSRGVYHLQGGGENRGITHAEVSINFAGGSSRVRTAEFVSSDVYGSLADDPIVEELLQKYAEQVEIGNRMVGNNPYYRSSNSIKQLVADLYYKVGTERWGEDYDIALGGGFISVRSPYELNRGEVTYGMLQMLLPFDNQLVLCSIKGSDLKSRFIETDNSNYFIHCDTAITDSIDPNKTYYIVTDTYCSDYKYNRLTVVAEYDAGVYARDLVADWLAEQ